MKAYSGLLKNVSFIPAKYIKSLVPAEVGGVNVSFIPSKYMKAYSGLLKNVSFIPAKYIKSVVGC
jgi:hypothetical protein